MVQLGLELIPSLKSRDIIVNGAELDQLEREATTILENMSVVSAQQKLYSVDGLTYQSHEYYQSDPESTRS